MFSLTSRLVALPGQRDALANILLQGSSHVPGCVSYVVTGDPGDERSLWINEVWDSEASHRSALSLARVKTATHAALPLIAGVGKGSLGEADLSHANERASAFSTS
jgi:quinol monooxygenase YgiN